MRPAWYEGKQLAAPEFRKHILEDACLQVDDNDPLVEEPAGASGRRTSRPLRRFDSEGRRRGTDTTSATVG